jgi:curved DNA-binding protein
LTVRRARELLGVDPTAEPAVVARAFRDAVKAAHPDRGGDAERLRQVLEANRLLKSLSDARLAFTPATRPAAESGAQPARRTGPLALRITVFEALYGGERRVEVETGRLLHVRLPAGMRSGESLRLAGASAGRADVLVTVTIAARPGLSVRGHDLWLEAAAAPEQLCEGARLEIDTPRGRRSFIAPKGAAKGAMVRLKGEGLPARGRHPAGDLIVRLAPGGESESYAKRALRRFAARWAA